MDLKGNIIMERNESNGCGSKMVDELLFVLNSVPKEKACVSQSKDLSSIKRKSDSKTKTKSVDKISKNPESDQNDCCPLTMSINSETKPHDLNQKPKEQVIANDAGLETKDNSNLCLNKECSETMEHLAETPINKIPKDILGNYGIVIEECECNPPEVDDVESDEDDFEDSRRLVIDEEKELQKTDEPSISELTAAKSESTLADLSRKKNTWGFTNSGHHLVISSVISLQNKICPTCDEVLPNTLSLVNHRNKHCSFAGCPEIIEEESDREKHMQIHKDHPIKPFRCEICRKRFHYYRFAQKHKEVCKILKRSKCPYCKYTSSKVGQFNKHVAKHRNCITCTDCKKRYRLVKKFSKHMYVHHRKQVIYQCTECPRRFQLPENIISHIAIHKLNISDCGMARFIQLQPLDQA